MKTRKPSLRREKNVESKVFVSYNYDALGEEGLRRLRVGVGRVSQGTSEPPCPSDGLDERAQPADVTVATTVPVHYANGRVGRIPVDVVPHDQFEKIWARGMNPQDTPDVFPDTVDRQFLRDVETSQRRLRAAVERAHAAIATERAFRWISILLPKHIRDEEIGDAREDLLRIMNDPTCLNVRRAVRWKIVSTWFWLLLHAAREVSAAILGKKAQ